MAMTTADFQDEVRENIKRDSTGVSDARILRWVNWSKDYLADLHTYEEMREIYDGETVADQKRYGFSTRMKDIYDITIQDGARSNKLTYVPARSMDTMIPRTEVWGTGFPDWYVDYGINFELYRTPDDAYDMVLRCSLYPIDLSASTDECVLLRKDALICAIATTFGFYALREIEDAAYWGSVIVPVLFEASLKSDQSAEDWTPVVRGFGDSASNGGQLTGQWWTNPFAGRRV